MKTPNCTAPSLSLAFAGALVLGFLLVLGCDSQSSEGDSIDVEPSARVEILFREFFSKVAGSGSIEIVLDEPGILWDTTVSARSDGWAIWDVPMGRYMVTLRPPSGASDLIRLRINSNMLDDPDAHWIERGSHMNVDGAEEANGRVTYAISDAQQMAFQLDVSSDIRTYAEYVADAELVDKMTRQAHTGDRLIMFDAKTPLTFVVYDGPCDVNWDRSLGGCGNGEAPGAAATTDRLANHEIWFNHETNLSNGLVVGGNPFELQRVVARSADISNYSQFWTDENIRAANNTSLVSFDVSTDRRRSAGTRAESGGPIFLTRTGTSLPGDSSYDIARWGNATFGQERHTDETSPPACSVQDNLRDPDCPLGGALVQFDFDDEFIQVAIAYASWSQHQKIPGGRGFNLVLK